MGITCKQFGKVRGMMQRVENEKTKKHNEAVKKKSKDKKWWNRSFIGILILHIVGVTHIYTIYSVYKSIYCGNGTARNLFGDNLAAPIKI